MNIKLILMLMLALSLVMTSACSAETNKTDAEQFKHEYELLNNMTNMDGTQTYQVMDIPADNTFVYTQMTDIEALLSEGNGVLYLGFPECPWCRALVPVLLDAAKSVNYTDNMLYYNALYDRDAKSLGENGEIITDKDGTPTYTKLVELLYDYLGEYEGLNDPSVKRIYLPTVVFVKDGQILNVHIDTVESHTDGYAPLTDEQYNELFGLLEAQLLAITGA